MFSQHPVPSPQGIPHARIPCVRSRPSTQRPGVTNADVSLNTLAGKTASGLDFSGDWWYSGQAFGDTGERIDTLELRIDQDGQWLQLAGARARPVTEGSYAWTGEMKLYDSEAFMGWYIAADGSVRSKGTLYFVGGRGDYEVTNIR